MSLSAGEIAARLDGILIGDPDIQISGVADAKEASVGEITFAEEDRFFDVASAGGASAILVSGTYECERKSIIQVKNVRVGWAQLLDWFHPEETNPTGIHPGSHVDDSAVVAASASIGPGCVIGKNVSIGSGAVLCGGNHIGPECVIGENSKLFPNAILYANSRIGKRVRIQSGAIVGSDGYVFDGGKHRKIAQIGGVVIGDDVELGANVTIDRGAVGDTSIGEGTKIDNLVQIAHNVVIGKHCIIISQTGIAGSTEIGDYTIIAGQVGIAGHLKIGSLVTIVAQSGVMRDIPVGQKVAG